MSKDPGQRILELTLEYGEKTLEAHGWRTLGELDKVKAAHARTREILREQAALLRKGGMRE